jgi:exonuclease III
MRSRGGELRRVVREKQCRIVVHEQVAKLPELKRDTRTEWVPVFLAMKVDVVVPAPDDLNDVADHVTGLLAVSDAGLTKHAQKTIWVRSVAGAKAPGMMLVTNARAAILFDKQRWESRWKQDETRYSSSGRSVGITFRLGANTELVVVATYWPDTPHENQVDTLRERAWVAQLAQRPQEKGNVLVLAGDFNVCPDETTDRQTPGDRQSAARRESDRFREWAEDTNLVSTYKHRHPTTARFTYANGAVRTALDDIHVSAAYAGGVAQSGIWLYSLHHSDHVGTPFAILSLTPAQQTRRGLREVRAIRRIHTKSKTQEDMQLFALQVEHQLKNGNTQLIASLRGVPSEADTNEWLERAVKNMTDCMYSAAKALWGETSQARREIDRAVSI